MSRGGLWRALRTLAGLSLLATVFVLLGRTFWFFELFTHFRVQLLAAQLPLFAACSVARRPAWAIALGAACIVNGAPIRAYLLPEEHNAPPAPAQTAPAELRVMAANVLASNRDTNALTEAVRAVEPDVLAVLELTPEFAAGIAVLHDEFGERVLQPEAGSFGIGIYSRLPIADYTLLDLAGYTGIDARIESRGSRWHFIAVHLVPPMSGPLARLRNAQLRVLAAHIAGLEEPHIVAGDFNLSPYSPWFTEFIDRTGLGDALRGFGPAYTWPSFFWPLGIPIDHVLVSADFRVADYFRAENIGSDHFPIIVDINRRRIGLD